MSNLEVSEDNRQRRSSVHVVIDPPEREEWRKRRSDIAEPRVRGALGALMQFQVTIGILFVTALNINGAVDWVVTTGICAGLPGNHKLSMILNWMELICVFLLTKTYERMATVNLLSNSLQFWWY